ncbi:MAG: hypothetical protein JRN08_09200 [Nitrososphaerota archaeon]|nr:hypothetical protein [Nitrososphaerota archaeon]
MSVSEADARLQELRIIRDFVDGRIKQIEEAKSLVHREAPVPASTAPAGDGSLEARLLKIPWSLAASGKCEYSRDVPAALLGEARKTADNKGELSGEKYHYVIKPDGAILRFKRRTS